MNVDCVHCSGLTDVSWIFIDKMNIKKDDSAIIRFDGIPQEPATLPSGNLIAIGTITIKKGNVGIQSLLLRGGVGLLL